MHAIIGESKRKEQTNALVNKSLIFSYVLSLPLSCGELVIRPFSLLIIQLLPNQRFQFSFFVVFQLHVPVIYQGVYCMWQGLFLSVLQQESVIRLAVSFFFCTTYRVPSVLDFFFPGSFIDII